MDNRHLSIDRAVHRWVHWCVRSLFNWHCIYHKKEMNKITEIVRELLEKKPELRDNDNLLMSTIWKDQANILNFFQRFESTVVHVRRTEAYAAQRWNFKQAILRRVASGLPQP